MNYNKYGIMSEVSFGFIESNYPSERFKKLPIIPVTITSLENQNQVFANALIDSGSTNSFIAVQYAKDIQAKIIDSIRTSGVTSLIEEKPVVEINVSNQTMDGKWVKLKTAVIDTHHPNYNLILGRDFMELFKQITFDFENQKTILNY